MKWFDWAIILFIWVLTLPAQWCGVLILHKWLKGELKIFPWEW